MNSPRTFARLACAALGTALLLHCGNSEDSAPLGGSPDAATEASAGAGGHAGAAGASAGGSAGSSAGASGGSAAGSAGTAGGSAGSPQGLSSKYPGDVGIEADPAVVWAENFEEGTVEAVTARYNDSKNEAGMELSPDVPAQSHGEASMKMTAGGAASATDLFKSLPDGYDEWYVRYYAKYSAGVQWHHTGVWIGGYNPPSNWPNPQAGLKPNGDDRFSISLEPIAPGPNPRLDSYNYWMKMHSWMDTPSGDTAYYGNSVIHRSSLVAPDDAWFCAELRVRINPSPSSGAGAAFTVWINDVLIRDFTDSAPAGYWVKDKFCPEDTDGPECTDYAPAPGTPMTPLDLQLRSVEALKLNSFWPQNFITEGPAGAVYYDDMIVATARVGCIQ